jgi:hypothetical protein
VFGILSAVEHATGGQGAIERDILHIRLAHAVLGGPNGNES